MHVDDRYSVDIDIDKLTTAPGEVTTMQEDQYEESSWDIGDYQSEKSKAKMGVKTFKIASISGWPETKTKMILKCKRILGQKVCTKWPQIYKRTSKLSYYLEVSHPNMKDVVDKLEDCVKASITASLITLILSGNIAAAYNVLVPAIKACLAGSVGDVSKFKFRIYDKKKKGKWKKI